jgi:hypothetical protein
VADKYENRELRLIDCNPEATLRFVLERGLRGDLAPHTAAVYYLALVRFHGRRSVERALDKLSREYAPKYSAAASEKQHGDAVVKSEPQNGWGSKLHVRVGRFRARGRRMPGRWASLAAIVRKHIQKISHREAKSNNTPTTHDNE